MLVMEYLELGSLLAYLQLHKNRLLDSHLLKFAMDVAEVIIILFLLVLSFEKKKKNL